MKTFFRNFILFFIPLVCTLLIFHLFNDSPDSRTTRDDFTESEVTHLPFLGDAIVRQDFLCETDNISGIEIPADFYADGTWELEVYDRGAEKTLFAGTITPKQTPIAGSSITKIRVPKINGTRGKMLSLILKPNIRSYKCSNLFIVPSTISGGELYVNGERKEGSLAFHLRRGISVFDFLDRVTQLKPVFIKGTLLYIVLFLYIYGIIYIAVYFMLTARESLR